MVNSSLGINDESLLLGQRCSPLSIAMSKYTDSWSLRHKKCVSCKRTVEPHVAKGYCKSCYSKKVEQIHKDFQRNPRGVAEVLLNKDELMNLYVAQSLSLSDIAKLAGTTRQNVYYKIRRYEIPLRSKAEARTIALDRQKIRRSVSKNDGTSSEITLQKVRFDETFFDSWSERMAYVLGLIFTDGNIHQGRQKKTASPNSYLQGRLQFGQKDLELVEKFLALIGSNSKITHRKRRVMGNTVAGELYSFSLASNKLYGRLVELGVKPNKSLTITFPDIPDEFVRHFIRGCWDGDGTVYLEGGHGLRAGFVSGSLNFVSSIKGYLEAIGLTKQNIYDYPGGKAFCLRYTKLQDCRLLFKYMYEGVTPDQYLERKYNVFKDGLK